MKRNYSLSSLAAIGLLTATVGCAEAQRTGAAVSQAPSQAAAQCAKPAASDVQALYAKIDKTHQALFESMDCEGQNMALQAVNQTCKGKNSCKGLNSCATPKNDCAGLSSCKGTTKGPFADKNEAVDVANMARKRQMKS